MLHFFITESAGSNCQHPHEYIIQDIRVDGDFRINDWRVQWCSLCGAFRSSVVRYKLFDAVVISVTEWRSPKNK